MNISKFNNFDISEAKGFPGLSKNFRKQGDYRVSFNIGDEEMDFSGTTYGDVYSEIINWLNEKGYNFTGPVHKAKVRKIFTSSEIEQEKSYNFNDFYEFDDDKFIMLRKINVGQIKSNILLILRNFGIDNSDIKFYGFDESSKSIDDVDDLTPVEKNEKKMTFINAAQLILKENDNRPMSANEIWDIIDDRDLVETKGTTPWMTLNAQMLSYSDNTNIFRKKKVKLFTIVENNPAKFKLINDDIVNIDYEIEDDFSDLEEIKPFGKFPQPFDVESELTRAQAQSDDDVFSFKKFRATEPNETPDELMVFNSYVKNSFSQAICVLGESGAGKSTTLDNILQKSGHVYQYIIPSASTTGLLSQFSPSAGAAGGYIPSRLGQMIEKAYNNKDVNYTAVFDECHKTSIIEMINDELLQAISKNRNKGVRFISLDDDTRRLYQSAQEDIRGNVLIPDNFGFIFISSNARVISGNPDFFNRVDLVEMTKEDQKMKTIEELNQKRVTSKEDKKELVNKIVSGGE